MPWMLLVFVLLLVPGAAWAARESGQAGAQAAARGRLAWRAWLPDVAGLALLALAALGFFWRVVTGQNWMPADGGDLVSFLYPTYRFAADTLREGAWPLWNPHLYAGAPHVADIQAGFLYPPNLLLFLLRPDFPYVAMQWLSLGHVWFAGAGMYLLLARGCRLSRLAGLAGALAFMFSDAFLVHFGNLNFNAVASWTPWIFWAYLAGLGYAGRGRSAVLPGVGQGLRGTFAAWRWPYAALAGILLGIATLAGHIQVTLFILLALAVFTLVWLWLNRAPAAEAEAVAAAVVAGEEAKMAAQPETDPETAWVQRGAGTARPRARLLEAGAGVSYLAVTGAVAVLLAAPVLLPSFQLAGYTTRAGWDYQQAAGYAVSPAQWIGLLVPNFFGSAPQFHWSLWPRVEVGYLGILPLVLGVLAVTLRRGRRVWVWLAVAAFAFLLALGPYALFHGWLTLLPGFGQMRAPARLVFIADLGLAALAAIGMDAALQPFDARARAAFDRLRSLVGWAAAATVAVILPLAYLGFMLVQDRDATIQLRASVALIGILFFAGLLLASLLWLHARSGRWARPATLGGLALLLILFDLGGNGAYQDLGTQDPTRGFQQPAIAQYLAAQPGPYRIDSRTGIEGQWQPDTALFYGLDDVGGLVNPLLLADVDRYWQGLGSRSSKLYDLLNVRYVVAKKDVVLDWQKFELAYDGSPDLNVYANRNWLPRAFFVASRQAADTHESAWQMIHRADFDPSQTAVVENATGGAGGKAHVTDIQALPNGLRLRVQVDEGPAQLVISQVWYPGWQVTMDGQQAGAPQRVDYLFQGVQVPAGSHEVQLIFAPAAWTIGLVLAGLALVALAVLLLWSSRRNARRRPNLT